MGYEELVDTLIADGHKTVSLISNKRHTDDAEVFIEEYLVLDESANIVARKICTPESYAWSMVVWPRSPSGNDVEVLINGIDLIDGAEAKGFFFLLAYE